MPRENGLILDGGLPPSNSFVVRDKKIVYMSVTKAACSSLRWMIADLAGEDPQTFFDDVVGPHPTRLMTIHTPRDRWEHVPRLYDLSPEELSGITPEDGWFIFAVVRDPWSRLWSAWQSKFLTHHTGFVRRYSEEPWFPRIPEKAEDVIEDFAAFVDAHPWTDNPELMRDSHFWPVSRSVRREGIDYTRIYDLSEMGQMQRDLKAHLAALGHPVEELYLPRANETPLHMVPEIFGNGVAEKIADLYAVDLENFGEGWDVSKLKYGAPWTDDAIRAVETAARVYERVADLRSQVHLARAELKQTKRKLRRTRSELKRLKSPDGTGSTPALEGVPTSELARTVVRRAASRGRRQGAKLLGR